MHPILKALLKFYWDWYSISLAVA